ncbi:hypothetical protein [Methylobacterium soli]|uniref:Uncharacterized protein n=1 Tax=Methylobacterium soli TaxID=553447 RepID=A0A6L3T148_9HYPH|nr:hypothetical protein [Methylobacterium soli]KAB1078522.1 hypothetical protein F6X53_14060 [Methylobacterium soli]
MTRIAVFDARDCVTSEPDKKMSQILPHTSKVVPAAPGALALILSLVTYFRFIRSATSSDEGRDFGASIQKWS